MWFVLQPYPPRPGPKGDGLGPGTRRLRPRVQGIFIHSKRHSLKINNCNRGRERVLPTPLAPLSGPITGSKRQTPGIQWRRLGGEAWG